MQMYVNPLQADYHFTALTTKYSTVYVCLKQGADKDLESTHFKIKRSLDGKNKKQWGYYTSYTINGDACSLNLSL